MKFNYSLFLFVVIIGLLSLSGCLFKQSTHYQVRNRALILENDSLMSENIELRRELEKAQVEVPAKRKRSTVRAK
ncbi:hypothetical protein [Paraflavitalea pollutisoli]|uniref:hypothetical protein n=1 Tax=Paraflavitalea pollutisoli TaxID=3034143 RepID=UPI0023EBCB83|nr:hypothetical protein [Paraflavitalea sp. H1-2-19X]